MIGTTIAHYRIEEKLGEGGMGRVYRARDSKLNRKVALKFLSPHLQQDDVALKRFLREAKSAAAIDHPYICNIFEIVRTGEGQNLIVMEYVEGQTLKEKLGTGPMSASEAVQIATEISEALELAHDRGIVHRDLKPSNIMLTPQNHVKVMDFGLAKRINAKANGKQEVTATLTREGSTLGTLAYMSPEQLKGAPVDPRSDIFSFGILLYEMLTGVHPFRRGQPVETVSAILLADPAPLKQLNKKISDQLENTVLKMLAREPEDRYQSIHRLLSRLNDPVTALTQTRRSKVSRWFRERFIGRTTPEESKGEAPRPRSIAVLPLANLSGDTAQEYFADGITEALITDLAKIGALKVISRSSTMIYKGTQKSLADIARELKVEALVEGSVLREGDRVGITAQLIEACTGHNLWADRYERNLTSILALQGEVAQAIAREIRITLTKGEKALLNRTRQVNPQAYDAYLRGQFHWYKLTPEDLETAMHYFELALEKDPDYALAYVGIALVWIGRQQMGVTPAHEAGPKLRKAVQQAAELDDTIAEVHYASALGMGWDQWDWEKAEIEFQRAIELNPNYADVRAYYAHFLMIMKRQDEAIDQMESALELDPFNPLFQTLYGVVLFSGNRYDDAIEQFHKALKTVPNHPVPHSTLPTLYFKKGMDEEAFEALRTALPFLGAPGALETVEHGYAEGGYREAVRRLAEWLVECSNESYVPFWEVAQNYTIVGMNQQALDWLERGFEEHDPNMPYVPVFPTFDGLHEEPRFQDLLKRMNFPEDVISRILD